MNKNKPWHRQYSIYKEKAEHYLSVISQGVTEEHQKQITSFALNSVIKLIFESNTIEKSGTKTLGETKRIVEEIKRKYNLDQSQLTLAWEGDFFSVYEGAQAELKIAKHGKSFRPYREVMQHWSAFIYSNLRAKEFRENSLNEPLFTVEFIKSLHKVLARDLLEEGLVSGEFRSESVSLVDSDLTFVSPELLLQAMNHFT